MDEQAKLKAILEGCKKGRRASQNDLYRLFYGYGMSVGIRYVNNEADAISIVNDVFYKVFKNINKFDFDRPFKPWFRRIIVNTALNHIKKHKKIKMEVDIDNAFGLSSTEEILSKINYDELIKIVQSLSFAYRTVFNMYVLDGYKHREIAETLNITESTSKSNLTRARAQLTKIITTRLNNPYV